MASKWVRCVACLGFGLACTAGARRAGAWEATQVTLQATALSYQKATVTLDGSSQSASASVTSFGLFGSGIGAGVGYAWDNLGFGVRASLQSASASGSSSGQSQTTVALFPRLEYQSSPGETGPFIAALIGINHTSTDHVSSTNYGFGGSLGMHGFIDPAVSIDPELSVIGFTGSQTITQSGFPDENASQSGVQVLLTLGLSGWITGRHAPSLEAPPAPETEAPPPAPAAPPDQAEAKPLSADIPLAARRRLYVQVSKDPARPSVLVRLTEQRGDDALLKCEDVSVFVSSGPIKLAIVSHGQNYVTGRLPLSGAEALVANPASTISVCTDQWQLSQPARAALQNFLNQRHDLLVQTGEDEPADVPAAGPAAPSAAPAPSVAPAPPAAPVAPPAPSTPTGTFAPMPAPAKQK